MLRAEPRAAHLSPSSLHERLDAVDQAVGDAAKIAAPLVNRGKTETPPRRISGSSRNTDDGSMPWPALPSLTASSAIWYVDADVRESTPNPPPSSFAALVTTPTRCGDVASPSTSRVSLCRTEVSPHTYARSCHDRSTLDVPHPECVPALPPRPPQPSAHALVTHSAAERPTTTAAVQPWHDPLGPLLVVMPPGCDNDLVALPDRAECDAHKVWYDFTSVEETSYCNTIQNLQSQLATVQSAAEQQRREAVREAEQAMQQRMDEYKADERQRRQRLQKTLDDLRDANVALTAQLDAAHCRGVAGPHAALTAASTNELGVTLAHAPDEWERREHEIERYWRGRIHDVQVHHERTLASVTQARDELVRQVRQLTRAADELHQTVRQLRDETAVLSAQNEQLKERCARYRATLAELKTTSASDTASEVARLQAMLHAQQARERALMAELEERGTSSTREQQGVGEQLQFVQRALEKERGRSAELVQLYSGQIESLHAQLADVTRQRDALTSKRP